MKKLMNDLPNTKKKVKSPNKDSLLFEGLEEIAEYDGWSSMRINERALLIIVSAIDDSNECPYDDRTCSYYKKEEISFSNWALNEMLELVWDHPWSLASEVIEGFALKCVMYEKTTPLAKQKRVFKIASKTAFDILEAIKEVEK